MLQNQLAPALSRFLGCVFTCHCMMQMAGILLAYEQWFSSDLSNSSICVKARPGVTFVVHAFDSEAMRKRVAGLVYNDLYQASDAFC